MELQLSLNEYADQLPDQQGCQTHRQIIVNILIVDHFRFFHPDTASVLDGFHQIGNVPCLTHMDIIHLQIIRDLLQILLI
ncbi:MAG: LytTR family transcriptional regulator DNA-binding domain-containing protein, partial [Eubacterium sp.]|nr:LytTR family transcriptional regulator DNA-binding domain-containing protein [Eubacterium sp.]